MAQRCFADFSWVKSVTERMPARLDYDGGHILVYGLVDPREGSLRYVGITRNRGLRLEQHSQAKWSGNNGLCRWERELIKLGVAPKMVTLGMATERNWRSAERAWIAFIEASGYLLYNLSEGGNVSKPHKNIDVARYNRWLRHARLSRESKRRLPEGNPALWGRAK